MEILLFFCGCYLPMTTSLFVCLFSLLVFFVFFFFFNSFLVFFVCFLLQPLILNLISTIWTVLKWTESQLIKGAIVSFPIKNWIDWCVIMLKISTTEGNYPIWLDHHQPRTISFLTVIAGRSAAYENNDQLKGWLKCKYIRRVIV